MAQYDVTHTCGHPRTYRFFGPERERDRKRAWLATRDCPACARASREATGPTCHLIIRAPMDRDRGAIAVALVDAYPIREALKREGYSFDPDANDIAGTMGMFATHLTPAWRRDWPWSAEGLRAARQEIMRLTAAGAVAADRVKWPSRSLIDIEKGFAEADTARQRDFP